ncbi:MAG: 2-oxo-4-hydroxy-4-carboxy-5-ureidoimidazoline decarboxylase [Gammaproteobacteria bacterium]|nr:2-oxo-4-hydroxy-4-carboxy-5-ureidoimidazoline decarboxylase [Gammaproteobacteria bacterium]
MTLRIEEINQRSETDFVSLLDSIFEHSPWVPELVYDRRPFENRESLHREMVAAMRQAPELQRMALLCSHPELAGKEAASGSLTDASQREQAGAGLDQCSAEELRQIQALNQAYRERFEFPFIIAVSGLDKYQIIAAMQQRLGNSRSDEFETALGEVEKIARIRIDALIDD